MISCGSFVGSGRLKPGRTTFRLWSIRFGEETHKNFEQLLSEYSEAHPAEDYEEDADHDVCVSQVMAAVAKLPTQERVVIAAIFLEGTSVRELAKMFRVYSAGDPESA